MSAISTPTTLAGYRLVRRLGVGSRAEVFLGVATRDPADSPRSVALKVFRADLPREDAGRELEALTRATSPHCVPLLDASIGPGGLPLPILGRLQRGSLSALLSEREGIEAGEAVTILAPLAAAVSAMHRAGVVHTAISPATVHFGVAGDPVLIGFGHPALIEPGMSPAALDEDASVLAERDRFAGLASELLARVRKGDRTALPDVAAWLADREVRRRHEFFAELGERLFDVAEGLPVSWSAVTGGRAEVPGRLVAPRRDVGSSGGPPAQDVQPAPTRPTSANHRAAEVLLSGPGEVVGGAVRRSLALARRRLVPAAKAVRPRFWIAGGAVGVALLAALALVPSSAPSVAAVRPSQSPSGPSPSPSRASQSTGAPPAAQPPTADPLTALGGLLASRAQCFRELSVLCLGSVDEQGSAAISGDSEEMLAVRSGGELPGNAALLATGAKLIERLGDSALMDLPSNGKPASVLMISTKAGWRLRSFFEGGSARTTG